MKQYIGFLLAVAACGGDGDKQDGVGFDVMPSMFTVGGTVTQRTGLTASAVSDAAIAVYEHEDREMALGTATTDASGKFTLTFSAVGQTDIVIEAKKSGFVTSYFYPGKPIGSDAPTFPFEMMSTANHSALYAAANGLAVDAGKGTVALTITSSNSTVAGATITSQPASAAYHYNDANGQPSASASSTATDGIAYALNAAPGIVVITSNKAGINLKNARFVVHAGALNQAVVTP
jgi:hypothetical protein